MPQATNITVKNAAGTDVVFELITPSGGDGAAAVWQLTSAGTSSLSRPRAEMVSRPNADKTARKVLTALTVPYTVTDSTTQLPRVVANIVFRNGEMTAPRSIPDTVIAEAVAYWAGLNASTLWKDCYKIGYAAV